MEYVTRHYGKPLDNGRLVAIRFSLKDMPQDQFVVFALIMDIVLRNKPDWLKASNTGASVKDKGFGNNLYKCNPKEFELAVLLESLIPIFAPKPLAVLRRQFQELALTPGGIAKGPSQIAITRRQLISRKHALRCPQDEYTPHTLFQALMNMVSHLDLPVIADMKAMFQLAVPDLGPLWNLKEQTAHRECLETLERVCPGCVLRWTEPTKDDLSRLPPHSDVALVGEEANPTTLLLLAHICAALDSVPEWLQWVQATDTVSVAGAAGTHAWGLMLPTSTRTPGVNYTSSVAVRYPPLNRQVGESRIVGTHSSGGLAGLVHGRVSVSHLEKTIQGIFTCQRSGPLIGN